MTDLAPKIDRRTAADVAANVQTLLLTHAPEWKELDPATGKPFGLSAALIGIFSRFAELIIERLNQAPQKNLLAFLDMLGNSPLLPQSARVPLTFSLASGSVIDGVIPAGTQAAAPPAEGEKDPVIFETERELAVTAAQLASIFVVEPRADRYGDRRWLASGDPAIAFPTGEIQPNVRNRFSRPDALFAGERQIEHIFYIGDDQLFGLANIDLLTVTIEFIASPPALLKIEWESWDGQSWRPLAGTGAPSGAMLSVVFKLFEIIPPSIVNGQESRWLRGRLETPVTLDQDGLPEAIPVKQLPEVKKISLEASVAGKGLEPEKALANQTLLDSSKEFYPFGERPKLGDALAITHSEAFAEDEVEITLHVVVANPATPSGPAKFPPPVNASDDLKLLWEYWTGRQWLKLGNSTKTGALALNDTKFTDATLAFTKSGDVSFTVPAKPTKPVIVVGNGNTSALARIGNLAVSLPIKLAPVAIIGFEGSWLRVRIVDGNYGTDARFEDKELDAQSKVRGFVLVSPWSFGPPIISSLQIDYKATKSGAPSHFATYNDFAYASVQPGEAFKPFTSRKSQGDTSPTLCLGFATPAGRFSQRALTVFIKLAEAFYGQSASVSSSTKPLRMVWEYRAENIWAKLRVRDGTAGFTRSGLIEFLPPADWIAAEEFGQIRHWLRVRWEEGEYQFQPRGRRVLLNTMMASQTVTITNETLGSSTGAANQKFRAARAPILAGQRLEVREPEKPSAEERAKITSEEGDDAIIELKDASGNLREILVRWHEVPDFYASGPRDRHYVLDHQAGEIRFGDSVNGLIPPIGAGNLQLVRYQTGGGKAGNRPAGSIVQLKTTLPYVDKVTNHEPAAGGADAETMESLLERAPRVIRHRDRAVTREDYEDLGRLASPEVARARCEPLFNLAKDPVTQQQTAGTVSLIIVPRSTDAKPLPTVELLNRVRDFLNARRSPNADLFVVGPQYVQVDVETEIALIAIEDASETEAAIQSTLAKFLHPLTGGLDGKGWNFGRAPHKSDLYALLEAIPGVDHIRQLKVAQTEDVAGLSQTGRFLVCSGEHTVKLSVPVDE